MKIIRATVTLLLGTALAISVPVRAQFVPGQVLTAAQLNTALANVASNALPIVGGQLTGSLTVPSLSVTGAPIPVASGGTGANTATGAQSQLQYQAPGAGAVARTYQGKFSDSINVDDYGAVGNCVTPVDDSAAIQNAINADTAGQPIYFPKQCYAIAHPLTIGNGSGSAISTVNGIVLQGSGNIALGFNGSNTNGTRLLWTGASGATMVTFQGPGSGFGFKDIVFDANNLAATGVSLISTRSSSYDNFGVWNFTNTGISMTIAAGAGSYYGDNNTFKNYTIYSGNSSVQYGWFINGSYANNNDWFRNTWINGITQVTAATAYAGYFEFMDHSDFINADFQNPNCSSCGLYLNGTNNASYPQNLFFYGSSVTGVSTSGNIGNNFFYNYTTADGEIPPNNSLLHVVTDTGSGINLGAHSFVTSGSMSTLSVTDTGSSGANIKLTGGGSTTPSKYIRANNGNLQICNSSYSSCPIGIADNGNFADNGGIDATAIGQNVPAAGKFTTLASTGSGAMPLYSTSGTAVNSPHMVQGTATLSSGAATVTFSGSAAYSSSTSYICTANDTTSASAIKVSQGSGTSITLTGTGSDAAQFLCAGI
jgi:hypothetical protein